MEKARRHLADFVEATSSLKLDPWQRHLCGILESLKNQRGRRILIHAPPQAGKSIIVSQRFPAWLIGQLPQERVKLACYNVSHAARFGKIVRDVLQSDEYAEMFPSPDLRLPTICSAEEWTTPARGRLRDAQPSFKALGLATGFVGQGADTLLIDDPYASAQDALSPNIRETVWTFWNESARVRLNDDTNVVVMFHRYHEDDLAGRMMAEEPDVWELYRYACICEGDWDLSDTPSRVKNAPDNVLRDPIGRDEGEKLSPRMSDTYIETQRSSGHAWLGQFQGRPTSKEGLFFKVGNLRYVDASEVPPMLAVVRAWDLAATEGAGDFTRGPKIGVDHRGGYWLLDLVGGQWGTDRRDDNILSTAKADGTSVLIHGPQDPGQAGKSQVLAFMRLLAGFNVKFERMNGPKETRAAPFASQVNGGNVSVVRAPWNTVLREEFRNFPLGTHDDIVDAAADAFNALAKMKPAISLSGGERPSMQAAQNILQRTLPQSPGVLQTGNPLQRPGSPIGR